MGLLDKLPEKLREILRLRVVAGMSAEETGRALGMTPGAVRVAQHRALNTLRGFVGHEAKLERGAGEGRSWLTVSIWTRSTPMTHCSTCSPLEGSPRVARREHDPAVKLLADLRLAVEVEDELPVETIDDPESFLARCAALNPVTDPFARKMAARGAGTGCRRGGRPVGLRRGRRRQRRPALAVREGHREDGRRGPSGDQLPEGTARRHAGGRQDEDRQGRQGLPARRRKQKRAAEEQGDPGPRPTPPCSTVPADRRQACRRCCGRPPRVEQPTVTKEPSRRSRRADQARRSKTDDTKPTDEPTQPTDTTTTAPTDTTTTEPTTRRRRRPTPTDTTTPPTTRRSRPPTEPTNQPTPATPVRAAATRARPVPTTRRATPSGDTSQNSDTTTPGSDTSTPTQSDDDRLDRRVARTSRAPIRRGASRRRVTTVTTCRRSTRRTRSPSCSARSSRRR